VNPAGNAHQKGASTGLVGADVNAARANHAALVGYARLGRVARVNGLAAGSRCGPATITAVE
jgi:hypothetical protein